MPPLKSDTISPSIRRWSTCLRIQGQLVRTYILTYHCAFMALTAVRLVVDQWLLIREVSQLSLVTNLWEFGKQTNWAHNYHNI